MLRVLVGALASGLPEVPAHQGHHHRAPQTRRHGQQTSFSHSSVGWKSKVRCRQRWFLPRAVGGRPIPGISPRLVHGCLHPEASLRRHQYSTGPRPTRAPVLIAEGPPWGTYPTYHLCEDPVPQHSHIVGREAFGVQPRILRRARHDSAVTEPTSEIECHQFAARRWAGPVGQQQ